MINDPDGAAVISLAGAAVALSTYTAESSVLVVELDQANRPARLEFYIDATTAHPSSAPAPITVRVEAALARQVVTRIAGSDQHFAERSYLVPVPQRINARAEHQSIDLRIPVHAVEVVRPGKIG